MKRASLVELAALLCFLTCAWGEEGAAPRAPAAQGVTAVSPAAEGTFAEPTKPQTSELVALEDLAKGDRVILLMKNGQQFEGHVAGLAPSSLTLDFDLSRQRMVGLVTFPRVEAAAARRLPALTKEEEKTILEKRRQRRLEVQTLWSETVGPTAAAPASPAAPTTQQTAAEERAAEEEQIADYRALLAEFPPEQGWGPERLAEIRRRHFIVGLTPTYEERRFWQIFDQWSEAKIKVEAYDQRQKQEQETLLTLFPPEEGWSAAKKQQLEEKQRSAEQLTRLEAQFLKDYDSWQKVVAAKQAEEPAAGGAPAPAASALPAGAPAAPPTSSPAVAPVPESAAPESPTPPAPGPEPAGVGEPAKP